MLIPLVTTYEIRFVDIAHMVMAAIPKMAAITVRRSNGEITSPSNGFWTTVSADSALPLALQGRAVVTKL
jgi:hypothetical protein